YLFGHAPLQDFLTFMTTEPIDSLLVDADRLADEWRSARTYLEGLAQREAGWAGGLTVEPIPAAFDPLVAQVRADPIYQRAFTFVPSELVVVELDRLVLRHRTLNLAQVRRVRDRLGATPDPEQIFRQCLPFDHPPTAFQSGRAPDGSFFFLSESNDLRSLETLLLPPEQVQGFTPLGPVAGVAAVVVGFG